MVYGKIIKGIAGFYYVHVEACGIYECKAKGNFRNKKIKPLVGDNVRIEIIDEENFKGNIEEILERKMSLYVPQRLILTRHCFYLQLKTLLQT